MAGELVRAGFPDSEILRPELAKALGSAPSLEIPDSPANVISLVKEVRAGRKAGAEPADPSLKLQETKKIYIQEVELCQEETEQDH